MFPPHTTCLQVQDDELPLYAYIKWLCGQCNDDFYGTNNMIVSIEKEFDDILKLLWCRIAEKSGRNLRRAILMVGGTLNSYNLMRYQCCSNLNAQPISGGGVQSGAVSVFSNATHSGAGLGGSLLAFSLKSIWFNQYDCWTRFTWKRQQIRLSRNKVQGN